MHMMFFAGEGHADPAESAAVSPEVHARVAAGLGSSHATNAAGAGDSPQGGVHYPDFCLGCQHQYPYASK